MFGPKRAPFPERPPPERMDASRGLFSIRSTASLVDSGGPCTPCSEEEGGLFCAQFETCMEETKREFVTATAISAMFGCFLMGFLANLPIALAPGMGKTDFVGSTQMILKGYLFLH